MKQHFAGIGSSSTENFHTDKIFPLAEISKSDSNRVPGHCHQLSEDQNVDPLPSPGLLAEIVP